MVSVKIASRVFFITCSEEILQPAAVLPQFGRKYKRIVLEERTCRSHFQFTVKRALIDEVRKLGYAVTFEITTTYQN